MKSQLLLAALIAGFFSTGNASEVNCDSSATKTYYSEARKQSCLNHKELLEGLVAQVNSLDLIQYSEIDLDLDKMAKFYDYVPVHYYGPNKAVHEKLDAYNTDSMSEQYMSILKIEDTYDSLGGHDTMAILLEDESGNSSVYIHPSRQGASGRLYCKESFLSQLNKETASAYCLYLSLQSNLAEGAEESAYDSRLNYRYSVSFPFFGSSPIIKGNKRAQITLKAYPYGLGPQFEKDFGVPSIFSLRELSSSDRKRLNQIQEDLHLVKLEKKSSPIKVTDKEVLFHHLEMIRSTAPGYISNEKELINQLAKNDASEQLIRLIKLHSQIFWRPYAKNDFPEVLEDNEINQLPTKLQNSIKTYSQLVSNNKEIEWQVTASLIQMIEEEIVENHTHELDSVLRAFYSVLWYKSKKE